MTDLAAYQDPLTIQNLLADADPANDPDVASLSAELQRLWTCAGTGASRNPCP